MSITLAWLAALGTVAVLVMYELFLAITQRRHPERLARSVNVLVRQDWFEAISQHSGSEILGVQTLRNQIGAEIMWRAVPDSASMTNWGVGRVTRARSPERRAQSRVGQDVGGGATCRVSTARLPWCQRFQRFIST